MNEPSLHEPLLPEEHLRQSIGNYLRHTHRDIDPIQRGHMQTLLTKFVVESSAKFAAGQKEHGGRLVDRDCVAEARKENTDLFWYLGFEWIKKNTPSHLL